MTTDKSGAPGFKIMAIPPDEDGCRFYIEQYKPFRLASLQQDAHAFGSTYERELLFDDAAWLARIKNPLATTFVAVQSDDSRVIASTSLFGPLPNASPASNPYQIVSEAVPQSVANDANNDDDDNNNNNNNNDKNNNNADNKANSEREPLFFQMSAVYTNPEARGQGLAKSLIRVATQDAHSRARAQGRPLLLSVVVYAANMAAISFYERCGFVKDVRGPKLVFNAHKNSSDEELDMYFQGVS
ncbi:hypothetical protein F5Y14DRAFT_140546 [Nemania sp. NC0429]|nr:hypothetical protein F5Y14DRAFT_140546 [Nemania sp. NC0429]